MGARLIEEFAILVPKWESMDSGSYKANEPDLSNKLHTLRNSFGHGPFHNRQICGKHNFFLAAHSQPRQSATRQTASPSRTASTTIALKGEIGMSIATQHGDAGQTGLAGGIRISKADLRVEAYGSVDELNAVLGFARSICRHPQIPPWTEEIQRTLFRVGAAISTPPEGSKKPFLSNEDVDVLTNLVHQIEATEGILSDWSLPGAHPESAAYEMARTVCRRAERATVRFIEDGGNAEPTVIPYLNRLSDLIWLFGRLIESTAGVDASLRDNSSSGPNWSRAW